MHTKIRMCIVRVSDRAAGYKQAFRRPLKALKTTLDYKGNYP